MREVDGTASPLAFFGAELRRARAEAGLSQDQVGQKIGYSAAQVGKIETGERAPSEGLAQRCDEVLGTNGLLVRVYELARRWDGGYPSWFAGWMDRERTATSLCWWEPLLIPGLVQTADYAKALFVAWQSADDDDQLDQLLNGRMQCQAIFERPDPSSLWVILDETVLHRHIGGPKIMHDQLMHLVKISNRSKVTIQVVPNVVGAHVGLLGALPLRLEMALIRYTWSHQTKGRRRSCRLPPPSSARRSMSCEATHYLVQLHAS
jgi:transcriptional regulator with XRE-family HTH domain